MRVAVTGATGVIGTATIKALLERGDDVLALSRDPERARDALGEPIELYAWPDPKQAPPPAEALERSDAVIHLLGAPIAQRWTTATKREIRESRVLATRSLLSGLTAIGAQHRPQVLVSQSASGYYGPRGAEPLDESSPPGSDFLAEVTTAWESEALKTIPGLRVATTRTGVVLSPRSGALEKLLPPFRLGVGGPVAGGRQYVPWIHLDDVAGALLHCLDHQQATGAINVTAPNPVTNAQLARTLGRVLHRPAIMPVPGLALRALYGEMAATVLSGQRVMPARLKALGYRFRFPDLEAALRDVLARQ